MMPPSVIHGWKAVDLIFLMVREEKILILSVGFSKTDIFLYTEKLSYIHLGHFYEQPFELLTGFK